MRKREKRQKLALNKVITLSRDIQGKFLPVNYSAKT